VRDDRERLADVLAAIDRIRRHVQDDRTRFDTDELLQSAVLHWIEIKTRGEQPSGSALADGAIAPVDLTSTDYARMADPVNLYKSLRWEPLMPRISLSPNRSGLTDVPALDRRHPMVVRPGTRMR
jgi:hypothetical protein